MTPNEFIALISPYAIEDMKQSNVLASITLAQGALESGWGKSSPGNNLFGIKGDGQQQTTQEFYDGKWVTVVDGFRVYDDWLGSIHDHSQFLIENPRYANHGFFDACTNKDYIGACNALQNAGYATDPNYANLLISIIQQHELYQYDIVEEDEEMIQELQQQVDDLQGQVKQLRKQIKQLQDQNSMSEVPDWASEAVKSVCDSGVMDTPEGRSLDLYSILTILHRKGLV